MAIVTGDRYVENLVKFVEQQTGQLIDGSLILKLNPAGLHYVLSRLEALHELESLLAGAPVDYLRAYVSDLGDHRALEQLRRILRLITSLKVVSVLPHPTRDPTPLSLLPFGRLRVLELRGCDLSTSAARGLLELRHTLEKIVCHNSTDALRHVFASRISEIKDSAQWNRLSFVSCACNRLVLMDESLQLLPAVETLDLSRNKFAKVDNLWKCIKLKHLDLGFNNLRSIAPFSEVSCNLIKLVLRNNALTTLFGLENLKSLEGLDVSYNIISNFLELNFLAGLPFLRNLWLEGNPLCCARWYRAHIFSYFALPNTLIVDDKAMSSREFWKRQLIIASRQTRPASFGFYSPARDDAEGEGGINRRRRKVSRLASIESEEESTCVSPEQESPRGNEIQSREENVSDSEAEIDDLISRVELMKKERSTLWLREFKDWLDHESDNFVDGITYNISQSHHAQECCLKNKKNQSHDYDCLKNDLETLQALGDESSANIVKSDKPMVDVSFEMHSGISLPGTGKMNMGHHYRKSHSHEVLSGTSMLARSFLPKNFILREGIKISENGSLSPLGAIDKSTDSSSVYPASPPHYQEDILHRCHNLVEEILQLSAESYSMASSDSNASSSEGELCELGQSICGTELSNNEEFFTETGGEHSSLDLFKNNSDDLGNRVHYVKEVDRFRLNSLAEKSFKELNLSNYKSSDIPTAFYDGETAHFANQEINCIESSIDVKKPRRRVVSVLERMNDLGENSKVFDGNLAHGEVDLENGVGDPILYRTDHQAIDKKELQTNLVHVSDDFIKQYFRENIADPSNNEACTTCIHCDCLLEQDALCKEREVVLLLSSENKLHILIIHSMLTGSGSILTSLGSHRIEDVKEVLVGMGLQVVRVYIEGGGTFLFLTRNIEKSRQLLLTLQSFGPSSANGKFLLKSLEQVQMELFEKQICRGSKMSIFQYSLVLFWNSNCQGETWVSRSLFVSGGNVFLCVEDMSQFSSPPPNESSSPYFSLDSSCSISDICELIIDTRESQCASLILEKARTSLSLSSKVHKQIKTVTREDTASGFLAWKVKWFSEESVLHFVSLLKAIRERITTSPLIVTCIS